MGPNPVQQGIAKAGQQGTAPTIASPPPRPVTLEDLQKFFQTQGQPKK